jgi:hypothetical protein
VQTEGIKVDGIDDTRGLAIGGSLLQTFGFVPNGTEAKSLEFVETKDGMDVCRKCSVKFSMPSGRACWRLKKQAKAKQRWREDARFQTE